MGDLCRVVAESHPLKFKTDKFFGLTNNDTISAKNTNCHQNVSSNRANMTDKDEFITQNQNKTSMGGSKVLPASIFERNLAPVMRTDFGREIYQKYHDETQSMMAKGIFNAAVRESKRAKL